MKARKYIDASKGLIIYFVLNIGISFLLANFIPKTNPLLKNTGF